MRRLNSELLLTSLSLAEHCVQTSQLLPLWLYLFLFLLVCLAYYPFLVALLRVLVFRAECITPFCSPTTSLFFSVLGLCIIPSHSLLVCSLSSCPKMGPLLLSCSAFTVISSLPPCSQKTCIYLLFLPAFLPLPAPVF